MTTEDAGLILSVQVLTDAIHEQVEMLEQLLAGRHLTTDEYKTVLGEVDAASLRVYGFRKQLLKQAREHAHSRRVSLSTQVAPPSTEGSNPREEEVIDE